ncbi:bifunctional DNA-formamidopyrimidine glycosylase/DNA-(apurinic or apyrimidinic site) lyase [Methylocella sp.]|uniref:bifunctional DNA-formamidopyrimidine glycosylase/DNA-(apurinic or apyrimidinic site) lyase n=1 Tax=Methylocella sp. TaxID=1978226 RepID=UPI0035B45BEF
MPELPEVETVRRGLEPALVGARILAVEQRRADLRFPFPERFTERLAGRAVTALRRRAKYLVAELDDTNALLMHLGMSGSFRIEAAGAAKHLSPCGPAKAEAHDHVVFSLSTGGRIIYNDPRRFGFMQIAALEDVEAHPLFRRLGLEPLGGGLDGAALARLFAGKATALKPALLDQSLIAGLGNIYVCEALHRAGLSPNRAAGTLALKSGAPAAGARRLAAAIRDVLEEALAAGGSSLRDHRQADGSLGYFQHSFRAYGREGEPCPTPGCAGFIRRMAQGGRSTFYCAACQR